MIYKEIKSIKSDKKELRKFGITMFVALGLLGGLFFWRGRDYYTCFLILSAVFLFLGIAAPILLWPVHKVWMTLAVVMGWVMTRVIMTILFYLIVTPLGLIARLSGKDFLGVKIDRNAESYWIPKKVTVVDYEKQF